MANPPARQRATTQTASHLKRGEAAMATLRQEQEAAESRRLAAQNRGPMRFYVDKNARGQFNQHEIVFLDDDLTQAPFAYEHTVPGPGMDWSKSQNIICVDEHTDCALCRAAEANMGDEFTASRYGMYATILDLTPYTVKKGPRAGEVIEATRKLIVIPHQQAPQFLKMAELCKKNNGGSTRGMVCVVTKVQNTDARCGIPQMLDNGMLFDIMSEDELEGYANEEVRRDNKVVKAAGEDIEPLNYDELLAPVDQKAIRTLFRLPAPAGSAEDEQAATGGTSRRRRAARTMDADAAGAQTDADAEADAAGETGEAAAPPPATAAHSRRTRAAAAPAPEPETPQDDAAPRRRRRSGGGTDIPFER